MTNSLYSTAILIAMFPNRSHKI